MGTQAYLSVQHHLCQHIFYMFVMYESYIKMYSTLNPGVDGDNIRGIQVNILSWKVFLAYHMGDVNSTYFRNSIKGQCTFRFRKKRSENVQLWTLVSPRIFIEKSWNFAQSCLNSSRIWGLFFLKKKQEKSVEKIKKLVGGVSASQEWSQKNPLAKRIFF